ncbi:MAG: hypothetical protein EA377_11075, partial [Phycisphaerales bacterium]
MIAALNWIALLALLIATYLAAVNMALMNTSRHHLERKLESRGRAAAGHWLAARLDAAVSMTALLRTAFRVTFFAVILI